MFYIKSELKRAIFSKTSFIAFIITLIALSIELINTIFVDNSIELSMCINYYDSADIFLKCIGYGHSSILCFIAPLLASLVFSNSYLHDKDSNFLKFIYTRMNTKKYIISRILVTAFSSGFIIAAALMVNLIIIITILGFKTNPNSLFQLTGTFAFIYDKNKWLYIIYIIFNSFIFNAIFALLGLGLSPFINNKYLAFLCPFAIYIFSMTILPYLGLGYFNMGLLFLSNTAKSEIFTVFYQVILLIVGAALFYIGVLHRNEKDL